MNGHAKKIRVAIADDHSIVREGLRQILLEDPGIEITADASDSREALEIGRDPRIDVLVLDVMMPGRGGLDTLQQMRRSRPELPVLMLSYHPEADLAFMALKMGAKGYLNKDRAPTELRAAVRKIAAGGRYIPAAILEGLVERVRGTYEPAAHETLSPVELQIFCLLATGRTTAEIAAELRLSPKTVGTYRTRILDTMEMKTHAQILHYAVDHGLAIPCHHPEQADVRPAA